MDFPFSNHLRRISQAVGTGRAKPEYIVTFNKDKNTIILVECKKSIKEHESSEKNMPQKYAVDGALFYAKHLKDEKKKAIVRKEK